MGEDTRDDDHGEDDDDSSMRADDDDIIAGGDAMNEARTEAKDWTRMVSSARTKSGERPHWAGGGHGFILRPGVRKLLLSCPALVQIRDHSLFFARKGVAYR